MIDDDTTPAPSQIGDHPELAILAALDHTLVVAEHALLAMHPVLTTQEEPEDEDDVAWLAGRILGLAVALGADIAAYRRALVARRRRGL